MHSELLILITASSQLKKEVLSFIKKNVEGWRINDFKQSLLSEAVYHLKNYGDQLTEGVITPSEISIILQMIRKPFSIIVVLFIQNNS